MATKPAPPGPLRGEALALASLPLAQSPAGGKETAFDGSTSGPAKQNGTNGNGAHPPQIEGEQGEGVEPEQDFAGMGSWLEDDDAQVFKTLNELVLRQELLAVNHLQPDKHYTLIKRGFPFSELKKDPNKDTYRQTMPKGMSALSIAAVPNQAWDLVNKATEAVLVDPPQPDPSPLNDSEEAQNSAEMAERFLTEDGGENGTNEIAVAYNALDKALTCATSFTEDWVDPVGGGYVPLQILAHPQAVSPENPLVGPDGMPTPNMILRYVTVPTGGQFTTDPAQAAPQWQPKLRVTVWGREHWRVYLESAPVDHAEKVIGLLYCTLAEAKRRWPKVAAMEQAELDLLLSWEPPRYLVLLPGYQRTRFRLTAGADANKSGSSDERIMFYYQLYQKATPDHKRGAELVSSGVNKGMTLFKDVLSAEIDVPGDQGSTSKEVRCMDIPVSQLTPRADPDDMDPQGLHYMELFCGATEFNAALATGFLEALNQWLHPDSYIRSTSSVQGFQVEESRMTGDAIPLMGPDDKPIYGNQPPLPNNFWDAYDRNDQAIKAIASLDKAVTGQQDPTKESGKALQIAVNRAMVGLARMQHPTNAWFARRCRIRIQLAMRRFTTEQTIRYVGEDGSYKAQQWKGTDFALVGNVGIQSGTGTMMAPDQKVNYIGTLQQMGMMPPDEAADAARETFAQKLGLPDNPHEQYIERCVALWLEGPPKDAAAPTAAAPVEGATSEQPAALGAPPDANAQPGAPGQMPAPAPVPWVQQWQQYQQAKQAYDQQAQQAQAQQQQQQAMSDFDAGKGEAPALPVPAPQLGPPPQAPWTPFPPRPNDSEPAIAQLWMKRLSKVISTVKYDAMIPEWQQALTEKYMAARQIVAQSQQPAPQPGQPQGQQGPAKPQPKAKPAQPQQPGAAA